MSLKAKDLKEQASQELETKLMELRQKYMELRFNHASGTLKNPHDLQIIRRDIARLLTIIGEKKK